ncbi:MAG: alpha/beta hydrolase-fold protein [Cryomorphaceae bacterium]
MRLLILSCCILLLACDSAPSSKIFSSRIDVYAGFQSEFVEARNVEVFLPRQYFESDSTHFRVLYMHDGQNVFNPETSYGGVAWEADSALQAMIDANTIYPTIVVAIWNNGMQRYAEYCPEKPFATLDPLVKAELTTEYGLDELLADDYLRFVTEEVKPFIDSNYRTFREASGTFIMGASMGGLISCYALLEHPEVFGGAACLSTHWPMSHSTGHHPFPSAMETFIASRIHVLDSTHRLYFDHGTAALDSLYPVYQKSIDDCINAAEWTGQYMSLSFVGAAHNEASWKARIATPLSFLLNIQ